MPDGRGRRDGARATTLDGAGAVGHSKLRESAADRLGGTNEGAGDRTQDPRLKRPLLYRLSYALEVEAFYPMLPTPARRLVAPGAPARVMNERL
jgi:hypothetical protein